MNPIKNRIHILLTKTIIAYEIYYVFYVLLNCNDERVSFEHGKPLVRAAIGWKQRLLIRYMLLLHNAHSFKE
jgi:hypothetical protein